jgi:hypothetical protein
MATAMATVGMDTAATADTAALGMAVMVMATAAVSDMD